MTFDIGAVLPIKSYIKIYSAMAVSVVFLTFWHRIIMFIGTWIFCKKCISERLLWQKVSFDWWMSAEWAARDEDPILSSSTNPCIPRAGGTQGVNQVDYIAW